MSSHTYTYVDDNAIRQIGSLPIRFVVNTHYHLDQVAGNEVFASAGAVVVAHRNVRAWLRTENLKFLGDAIKPEDKARVQALKLPDVVYDDHLELYLGKRLLQVRFLRGTPEETPSCMYPTLAFSSVATCCGRTTFLIWWTHRQTNR